MLCFFFQIFLWVEKNMVYHGLVKEARAARESIRLSAVEGVESVVLVWKKVELSLAMTITCLAMRWDEKELALCYFP